MGKMTNSMDLQRKLHGLVAKDTSIEFERHQLCSLCRSLASKSGIVQAPLLDQPMSPEYESFAYHDTKDDMIEAVVEGCHLCASMEALYGDALMFPSTLWMLRRSPFCDGGGWIMKIGVGPLNGLTNPDRCLKMNYYARKQPEHGPWGTPDQASLYTGSDASLAKARDWLLQCRKNHSSCQRMLESSGARPRRLLEVGKSSDSTIRVCLSESLSRQSKLEYLTLSHCWGKAPVIQLKEGDGSDIQAMHQSISFDSLPLTFQHAVTITRKLGFEYLWIDSLCIIQNSTRDWIEQSAIMGAIYQRGTCNIAATSSKDSRGGCYVTRNPLLYTPCNLSGSKYRPTVVEALGSHTASRPLLSRAWVFQERTLSPRTLHFGPSGIDWECTELYESSTRGYNANLKQALFGIKSQVTPPPDFCISDELWSFLDSWARILSTFSGCDVTLPQDRLVALNGIVEDVSRKSGFTSIAGLWKEVLPLELLWHRKEKIPMANTDAAGHSDAGEVYIAPSWSWAACNGEVTTYYSYSERRGIGKITSKIVLKVLDISVTAESNGLVLPGAQLRVSGPTRQASWSKCCTDHGNSERFSKDVVEWFLDKSVHELEEVHLLLIARTRDDFSVENFAYTLGAYPENEPESFQKIWKTDYGLILQRLDDQTVEFRRVGFFSQSHEYGDQEGYKEREALFFPTSILESIETFTII